MQQEWYSVEQVAGLLGLHVRTVRGYIRDGQLHAVRLGKQYRISQADLDAFTGRPASASPGVRAEVSAVVEFDGIGADAADRLSTLLVAGAQPPRATDGSLRVRTAYDPAQARLKIVLIGGLEATAGILRTIDEVTRLDSEMTGSRGHESRTP